MSLFKYLTAPRIGILQTLEIRFSPPALFNDPFEMKPHVPTFGTEAYYAAAIEPAFERIVDEEYASLPPKIRGQITKDAFQAFANTRRSEILKTTKVATELALPQVLEHLYAFWNRIGILCLSECVDSLLMWAHYADSHKGFVIEFDERNAFFDQRISSNDELRHLRKVHYSDTRPSRSFAEIESLVPFLTKSSDWSYEREWRMLLPLDKATRVISSEPFSTHLFSLPPDAIRSIYLGCRAEPSLSRNLMEILQSAPALSHVKVYQGSIDSQHFRLNFELLR